MIRKRSTFKSDSYWRSMLESYKKRITRFASLAENPRDAEQQETAARFVWTKRLELVIAMYSAGESPTKMKSEYPRILEDIEAYQRVPTAAAVDMKTIDGYMQLLWLLSLGILLGEPSSTLKKAAQFAGPPGQDALFDSVAAGAIKGRRIGKRLLHPKPFEPLYRVARGGDEPNELITEFLSQYYKGLREAYFYNKHLKDDAGYFGYWSFELAAVVVQQDLDDADFRDNIYYPADLADFARESS